MAVHKSTAKLQDEGATLSSVPPLRANRRERLFDLPPAVHAMLAGSFFVFLAILGAAGMDAMLSIPFAMFMVFLAMFFAIPAVMARFVPETPGRYQSWSEFMRDGIATGSGLLKGREAIVQIMTLPVLMIGWACFITVYWSLLT